MWGGQAEKEDMAIGTGTERTRIFMPRPTDETNTTELVPGPGGSYRPRHRITRDRQWTVGQRHKGIEPDTGERKERSLHGPEQKIMTDTEIPRGQR